eukprot:PITA_10579
MENLKRLKKATIEWAAERRKKQNESLNKLDIQIRELEDPEADAYATQESKERIVNLEKSRAKILLDKEEEWKLKSRAIWLKEGDENTKFFHNYAKGRKNANTIWKLKDSEGREASNFEALSDMGKNHFQSLFSDPGGVSLAEIIRTAQSFPLFEEGEEAEDLFQEVTKEEVESIIKSMAKDKSPGPDGWTVELFHSLFRADRGGVNGSGGGIKEKRQIHEAIGVAQETIHNIRNSRQKGAVIKIDLSKAYDRISWTYLGMLLTHLGFKVEFISWIMGCISSVSFVVLINGAASQFFRGHRGLRQGCPLSPLLFLLAAEGLSKLISNAKRSGLVKGLEVAVNFFISHLLFVDDILLFTNGSQNEIKELKSILDMFLKVTGLQINSRKSQIILEGFNRQEELMILSHLPFEACKMENSFKYLGFWLKPLAYRKQDWNWLVAKIEQRISHWSFKWLSRAGRLTLVNSFLQAMPVFWAALTWIPKGILHKIKQICSRFLWSGTKEDSVLPWVARDKIARPKDWGGWGIKNLFDFSVSLAAKSSWRLITSENLWTRVVKRKYIDPLPLDDWIRNPNKKGRNFSVIWKATVEAFKVIEQGLAWQVGNGEQVRIGRDPWVGCNESFALPPELTNHLDSMRIQGLNQIANPGQSTIWGQAWKSIEELGIDPRWRDEWRRFIQELKRSNVRIQDRPDQLVWAHAESSAYTPKMGYSFLMKKKGWVNPDWWVKPLLKLKCPKKARLFSWCILRRKIRTWDVLQSRYKQGPGRCPLCFSDSKSIHHLFIACPFARKVWEKMQRLLGKLVKWEGDSFLSAWEYWWNHYPERNLRNLPPIICWGIWIARNRSIFKEQLTPAEVIAIQSSAIFSSISEPKESRSSGPKNEERIREGIPWAYFDGAAQNNNAGAGIVIHISPSHSLKADVGLGPGTNNFAELSALKLLLCWLITKNISSAQIFGDSLNVINWVNGKYRCQNYMLRPLLEEIQTLKSNFNSFSIEHIYRDRNGEADNISKEGLQLTTDSWRITEQSHDQIRVSDLPPHS